MRAGCHDNFTESPETGVRRGESMGSRGGTNGGTANTWGVLLGESLLEICGVCYLASHCCKYEECVTERVTVRNMWSVLLEESLLEICGQCYLVSHCWKYVECVNLKKVTVGNMWSVLT